jgi:tetrapyrrole methylase family protein/MazG family protein/ATP diphosphatase
MDQTENPGLRQSFLALAELMRRLRDPVSGCPWDVAQTYETIAPYTIEEAYEVADAIGRKDVTHLREELGDLLFQVFFHSRIAEESGHFTLEEVVTGLVDKMTRRHPHVFGDQPRHSTEDQPASWEAIKEAERKAKAVKGESILDSVPIASPALMRAEKLTKAAAKIGFDWPDVERVLEKLDEERAELTEAVAGKSEDEILDEMGDLLFVCANVARKLKVSPEEALRRANEKFVRRFRFVEEGAKAAGRPCSLEELEEFWQDAKRAEKS